jgi:predicted SnoaL-like aldol condensation-catalyzing enzyme
MKKRKQKRSVSKMTRELLKEFLQKEKMFDEETTKELNKFYDFHQKTVIEKKPSIIEFLALKKENKTDKKLKFDFNSGDLVIIGNDENSDNDSVVVDSIYKDGFFCEQKMAA